MFDLVRGIELISRSLGRLTFVVLVGVVSMALESHPAISVKEGISTASFGVVTETETFLIHADRVLWSTGHTGWSSVVMVLVGIAFEMIVWCSTGHAEISFGRSSLVFQNHEVIDDDVSIGHFGWSLSLVPICCV